MAAQDGKRIFVLTTLYDFSGSMTVGVRERACLALSSLTDSAGFIDAHQDNAVQFPLLSSVRLVNTKGGLVVVEAEEQSLQRQPTKAMEELLEWLRQIGGVSHDRLGAAPLAWLRESPHYPMVVAVPGGDGEQPCEKMLAMVRSVQRSTQQTLGTGFRISTKGITCALEDSLEEVELVSMATAHNLKDCVLDPPKTRDRSLVALVLISQARSGRSFLVEQVQILRSEDVDASKNLMQRLVQLSLASEVSTTNKKRSFLVSDVGGMKPRTCRALSACPTDPPLPDQIGRNVQQKKN